MNSRNLFLGLAGVVGLVLLANRSEDAPVTLPANNTPPRVTHPGHYQLKVQSSSGVVGYSNIDFPNAGFPTMEAFIEQTVKNGLTVLGIKVYRFPWDTSAITAGERATVAPYPTY